MVPKPNVVGTGPVATSGVGDAGDGAGNAMFSPLHADVRITSRTMHQALFRGCLQNLRNDPSLEQTRDFVAEHLF